VGQVTTVWEIQTHQPVVGAHDGLVNLEVGGRTRQALDIDSPLLGVATESLEGSLLASELDGVNVLVAAVVTCAGVSLRVLVAHGRPEGVEDGPGGDVLRGDEENRLALALNL